MISIVRTMMRNKIIVDFLKHRTKLVGGTLNSQRSNYEQTFQEKSEKSILLSDSCVRKLQQLAANESFIRLSIDGGGCSGFQYKFELDTVIKDDDKIFEEKGVKLVVDETSLEYVKGSTVDYHEELIRSGFRIINNPQAAQGCSCGASFSIKV